MKSYFPRANRISNEKKPKNYRQLIRIRAEFTLNHLNQFKLEMKSQTIIFYAISFSILIYNAFVHV